MSVEKITYQNKEIILIGTAHVSRQSAEEVKEIIEAEKPDSVCVELCQSRYESIINKDKWRKTDIYKVIKEHKATLLLVNLILSSFQSRLARQFGIQPGQEMIQGVASGNETGATLCLADRDIQTTFLRVWRGLGFFGKIKLFVMIFFSIFNDEELTEEEIEKLKTEDMLTMALSEFTASFPRLKEILINERDMYLAQKIKEAPGPKIVAVVGAGHLPGIKEQMQFEHDLREISAVPPPSKITKVISWAIPALILILIIMTFSIDSSLGLSQVFTWIVWNGSLSALGALLAFAHPVSIVVAFVAAPITSLNPLLAAGWFAGLSEAYFRRPSVEDFERLPEDITTLRGFWRNKFTHVLLVVAISNLGSSVGTIIGGTDIIRKFLEVL
ncbi:MAG: TraB/GumN family protein [Clostridia bacterium]|jgi:pheromone shutdown-related protein TraB|nr:TraB/GumN family protein [Clostridia bacterium]